MANYEIRVASTPGPLEGYIDAKGFALQGYRDGDPHLRFLVRASGTEFNMKRNLWEPETLLFRSMLEVALPEAKRMTEGAELPEVDAWPIDPPAFLVEQRLAEPNARDQSSDLWRFLKDGDVVAQWQSEG